jgi:hypothetical protein
LEGKTMDCSIGKGGKMKGVRIGIKIGMVMLIIQKKNKTNKQKIQVPQ